MSIGAYTLQEKVIFLWRATELLEEAAALLIKCELYETVALVARAQSMVEKINVWVGDVKA